MKIISKQAKELNNFLRIDMENSDLTDQTFKLLKECKNITKDVGVALQAYLFRSLDDIDTLADSEFNARICKGFIKKILQSHSVIDQILKTIFHVNG